jgi:transforming growth factor-beta-induced protein
MYDSSVVSAAERQPATRFGLTAVILILFAIVVAACGSDPTPTPSPAAAPPPEPAVGTIVDVAIADGRFETLVAAVVAADLAGTLSGEGPFTVFAPTDDAFAALPEGTVEGLLADVPALTDVLLYHVVSGAVLAADVVGLDSMTTLQGSDVAIEVRGGNVFGNEAQFVITDIETSNGVIHVIDAVLLPAS